MKIILKKMDLFNFKGLKSMTIELDDHIQNVFGANATGKTRLFTAFLWNLFGKDIEGRKDYEIKPTDESGQEVHKLDYGVTCYFDIDGQETVTKRILREKWPTPRGAASPVFEGNVTVFEWNGVPMREKDYQEKINKIVAEDAFKLLTNPLYFNTGLTGYKIHDWQARRNVLVDLAGEIKDTEIAAGNTRFEGLLKQLTGKSLVEYKQQISAQKKKIRETLDRIPTRIDEATRALPETLDFASIDRQILAKELEITGVDQSLTDAALAQKGRNNHQLIKQNQIFDHKTRLQSIESEIRSQFVQDKNARESEIKELRSTGRSKDNELNNLNIEHKRIEGQKISIEKRMADLRAEWSKVDATLPEPQKDDFKCPSCHQDLPSADIEKKNDTYQTYLTTFNSNKAKRLTDIKAQGTDLKNQVDGLNKSLEGSRITITTLEQEITELRTKISALEAESLKKNQEADQSITNDFGANAEAVSIRLKIQVIEAEIISLQNDVPDNSDIRTQRHVLTADLDALKKQRDTKDQIECGKARIAELGNEEKDLSQKLVELEGIEFVIQEFTRAKIDALESRINHKFKYAKFKLFDRQVNGQEVECCETMYEGVVFGSLNTASRVLVGIDIINVLSAHYGVSAPIFLDNRESVTSIPDTDAQVINLSVMEDVDHLCTSYEEAVEVQKENRKKLDRRAA